MLNARYELASKLTKEGSPYCCGPILDHLSTSAPRSPAVWKAVMAYAWQVGDEAAFVHATLKAIAHCGAYRGVWLMPKMHSKVISIVAKQPPQMTAAGLREVQPKAFLDSAHLEWKLGNIDIVRQLLCEGMGYYPKEVKLWVALGEFNGDTVGPEAAHSTYTTGLRVLPTSSQLKRCLQIAAAAMAAAAGESSGNSSGSRGMHNGRE